MRTKGERLSVKEEIRKEERKDAKIFLEKKKRVVGPSDKRHYRQEPRQEKSRAKS